MALGRTYRFVVLNSTGVSTVANLITVLGRRWNFNTSGIQTWEGATSNHISSGDGSTASAVIANNGYGAGVTIDNSTTAYLGGTFEFKVDTTGWSIPSGTLTFYLQRSPDGGTTWPDNGFGTVVAVLNLTAATTVYKTVVEI